MLQNINKTFSPMPDVLREAQQGKQMKHNAFVVGLIAFGIMLAATFAEFIALIPYAIIRAFLAGFQSAATGEEVSFDMTGEEKIIAQLFVTGVATIFIMLYVKFDEKRPMRTMGFVKKHAVTDYLLGMVIAFAMFSACIGMCVATGAMEFNGYVLDGHYISLALLFVGFIIQGMSEEVICRGFMMTSFGSKAGAFAGMMFNSLVFGALHLGNAGIAPLAMVNLVLFGVFMSILMLKLNSIWMICAIHSVWNFVQGNFYGVLVSGIDSGSSVFRFNSVEGFEFLNGGSFGMEGGIATTIVLGVAIIITLCIKPRSNMQDSQTITA